MITLRHPTTRLLSSQIIPPSTFITFSWSTSHVLWLHTEPLTSNHPLHLPLNPLPLPHNPLPLRHNPLPLPHNSLPLTYNSLTLPYQSSPSPSLLPLPGLFLRLQADGDNSYRLPVGPLNKNRRGVVSKNDFISKVSIFNLNINTWLWHL